jgi:protein-tyrosine phosphatase
MRIASLIPGTFNARDLGGLPARGGVVRAGMVVRSDAPLALGEAGRGALRRLGIRTAIDLREPVERRLDPPDLDGLEVTVEQRPILGEFDLQADLSLEQIYMSLLENRGDRLTAAVALLAKPGTTPALVFCSAGKDRTGLVSGLLLGALGVSDDEIVADYHRTEESMRGPMRAAVEARAIAAGIGEQQMAVKVGAPEALMRQVLAWLREHHGGAEGFLSAHGLPESDLQSLRRALVQPRASAA